MDIDIQQQRTRSIAIALIVIVALLGSLLAVTAQAPITYYPPNEIMIVPNGSGWMDHTIYTPQLNDSGLEISFPSYGDGGSFVCSGPCPGGFQYHFGDSISVELNAGDMLSMDILHDNPSDGRRTRILLNASEFFVCPEGWVTTCSFQAPVSGAYTLKFEDSVAIIYGIRITPPEATPTPPEATPIPPEATPTPPEATPTPPEATPIPPEATPTPPEATPTPCPSCPPAVCLAGEGVVILAPDGRYFAVEQNQPRWFETLQEAEAAGFDYAGVECGICQVGWGRQDAVWYGNGGTSWDVSMRLAELRGHLNDGGEIWPTQDDLQDGLEVSRRWHQAGVPDDFWVLLSDLD